METTQQNTDPAHIVHAARDVLTVRRVFGEAYERQGTLVIPVAKIWGGTGSGWGSGSGEMGGSPIPESDHGARTGEGSGGGGGFGVRVKPLGVYIVDDSGTKWQPTLDLNRVIVGGQIVGIVVAVIVGWVIGRRRR